MKLSDIFRTKNQYLDIITSQRQELSTKQIIINTLENNLHNERAKSFALGQDIKKQVNKMARQSTEIIQLTKQLRKEVVQ